MIGRALGVGVRVAGRMAGQRLAAPQASPSASIAGAPQQAARQEARSPLPARPSFSPTQKSVRRGIGGFLRPFRRVGSILWLEITGIFFLLPVIVFAPTLWRAALAYPHTSDHRTLWVASGVVAVFLYLGVSSFWRAHRRAQRP